MPVLSVDLARAPRVPRTAHLASGTLPGAGAYTSQSAYTIPDGVQSLAFYVTYTRGADGGAPKFRLLLGNGTEEGVVLAEDDALVADIPGPPPADGSPVVYTITVTIRSGQTTIRLLAAEAGAEGTPGTCAIALTAGY